MMLAWRVFANGRRLSTVAPNSLRAVQEKDMKLLNDFFPTVVRELQEESTCCNIPSETAYLGTVLEHNVPGGKMIRGLAAYHSMRELARHGSFDDELYHHKAKCLAWSMELVQSYLSVLDDIVDECPLRRGAPAWYRLVGPGAIFDGLLIEHSAFRLWGRHFEGEQYSSIVKIYTDTMFEGGMGQLFDIHCTTGGNAQFEHFSVERYKALCNYKSGPFTFYMPVAMALIVNGWNQPVTHEAARDITNELGYIYQVQNDYADVFGDQAGKVGTDIQTGKCTWLITEAKKHANARQLEILKENYGSDDQEKIQRVVDMYNELHLKEVFLACEKDSFDAIQKKINLYSDVLPPTIYTYVFESIKHHINK